MTPPNLKDRVQQVEQRRELAPAYYRVNVALFALLGFLLLGAIVVATALVLSIMAGWVIYAVTHEMVMRLVQSAHLMFILAIPSWILLRSTSLAFFIRLEAPLGIELLPDQAPDLFSFLDELRRRTGGPRVHHVMLVDGMVAAVSSRPAFGLFGWPRHYLILGMALLDSIGPEDTRAVLAHEYGHLVGSDGRFGAFIYRIRRSWKQIDEVMATWHDWAARPLRALFRWYVPRFLAYTFVLARHEEYRADAASAKLVGSMAMFDALKRIQLVEANRAAFLEGQLKNAREFSAPPKDLGSRWAEFAALPIPISQAKRWLEEALSAQAEIEDTHPTLRQRLLALEKTGALDEIPAESTLLPASSAWLVNAGGNIREFYQRNWYETQRGPWRTRHLNWRTQVERLDRLGLEKDLSVSEQIELFTLRDDLRPDDQQLQELASFNAINDGVAKTLVLEGKLRCAQDDPAGLPLLLRGIELDGNLTAVAVDAGVGFCVRRDDFRGITDWLNRLYRRQGFEQARRAESLSMDPSYELLAVSIEGAARLKLAQSLAVRAAGIKRIFLARRYLRLDPSMQTWVLGVEFKGMAFDVKGRQAVLHRLLEIDWPETIVAVTVEGKKSLYLTKFEQLQNSEILAR